MPKKKEYTIQQYADLKGLTHYVIWYAIKINGDGRFATTTKKTGSIRFEYKSIGNKFIILE